MIASVKQAMDSQAANASPILSNSATPNRLQGAPRAMHARSALRDNTWALCLVVTLAGCASHPSAGDGQANDPLESTNRAVHHANDAIDRTVIKPVAKGYQAVLPQWVRDRIRHFFDNLTEPRVFANAFLQVRVNSAGTTFTRFLVNSTVGVFGLFDVASNFNMPRQTGDFGQTLARWGVGEGPYLVLPIFGSSNLRDAVGLGGDLFTDFYVNPAGYLVTGTVATGWNVGQAVTSGVDLRARNIDTVDTLQASSLDNYAQMRSLTRQHRAAEIREAKGLPNEPEELTDPGAAPTNHLEAAYGCADASCR